MILVTGHFRIPTANLGEAKAAMLEVIAASRAENGCRAYSYAADVAELGLFRVYEEWDDRAALELHFASPHMREWQSVRTALGFTERTVVVHEVTGSTPL